jgi:hypothetical protein
MLVESAPSKRNDAALKVNADLEVISGWKEGVLSKISLFLSPKKGGDMVKDTNVNKDKSQDEYKQ